MESVFRNRLDAGKRLGAAVSAYISAHPQLSKLDRIVLALPRGGVPVGWQVAQALKCPLDVLLVRKLGVPSFPELAMGAIAGVRGEEDDRHLITVWNDDVLRSYVSPSELNRKDSDVGRVIANQTAELHRRNHLYRQGLPPPTVAGRLCIVVDDGIATGATALAAVRCLRQLGPASVMIAVPVASPDVKGRFLKECDHFVNVLLPRNLSAVGQWYLDFRQTEDNDVVDILNAARATDLASARSRDLPE